MNSRNLVIAAGVGGALMGVLSATPLISAANCILCLWVWVGAGLAVMIYTQMEHQQVTSGEGALIGALAGGVGAIIVVGLSLLFGVAMVGMLATVGSMSRDELPAFLLSQGISLAVTFVLYIVVFPGIGAVAGALSVELIKPDRTLG